MAKPLLLRPLAAPAPAAPGTPGALRVYLSNFVGREAEIGALLTGLENTRLLTLTGAGGSGKTRLATAVAERRAAEGGAGTVWVELATLTEPGAVRGAVAAALGVRDAPAGTFDPLVESVRADALLLVLDNCEHLIEACADLAHLLLRTAPRLRILATSREPLGIEGEVAWPVPPLSLPPEAAGFETAAKAEAVRLFVDRARAAHVPFHLTAANTVDVVRICRRLDALPLALELAAARVRSLSPAQIADRLDDAFALLGGGARTAPARHRTLRAAIDWSHALLSADEQTLFARLGIFAGGFSLDAAEAVCAGDGLETGNVLDLLAALVDRSLVTLTEAGGAPRYHLLEVVRQYAAERLRESGGAPAVRERHLRFFLARASEAGPHLPIISPTRALWIPRLLPDAENLRAALATARSLPDPAAELGLLAGSWWLWHHLGAVREAHDWMRAALDRTPAETVSPALATVLLGAAFTAWMQCELTTADALQARSVALWQRLGPNGVFVVRALAIHSHILRDLGRLDESRRAAEDAIAAAAGRGLPGDDAFARVAYGNSLHAAGALAEAETVYHDAETRWRAGGQSIGLAFTLWSRAVLALDRGEPAAAALLARQALAAAKTVPNRWFLCRPLEALAVALIRDGDTETGVRLAGAAAAIRAALGTPLPPFDRDRYGNTFDHARAALGPERWAAAHAAGEALSLDAMFEAAAERRPDGFATLALHPDAAGEHAAGRTAGHAPAAVPGPSPPIATASPAAAAAAPGATAALRVRALGPLRIERDGERGAGWTLAKPRELLLFLLMHPAGVTREQVGVALWPEASKAQVSNNFHVTLHRLRRVLGGAEQVIAEQERYRLSPGLTVDLDAHAFEAAGAAALALPEGGDRLAAIEAALARNAGDFLEGEPFGDWTLVHRDRLRRLWQALLVARAEAQEEAGLPGAVESWEQVLASDAYREDAWRRLMTLHARAGRRTSALALYRRLEILLDAEFGAAPEPATAALYRELAAQTVREE